VSIGVPLVSRRSLLYVVLCPLFHCGALLMYLIALPYGFLIYTIFTYQKKKREETGFHIMDSIKFILVKTLTPTIETQTNGCRFFKF
jgi:hypothetical protein